MKKVILIIFCFLIVKQAISQIIENCPTPDLVVVAENLNFRNIPNVESKSKGFLENGELLTFLEFHKDGGSDYRYYLSSSWLKVRRDKTNEIGYVFGQYVKPQSIAYMNNQDCDKIQSGYWYGIFEENGKVMLDSVSPKLVGMEMDDFKSISVGVRKYKLIIGSQEKLREGQINGKLFPYPSEYVKIGTSLELLKIENSKFSLVCTGKVELRPPFLTRENEKLIFLTTKGSRSKDKYQTQDLTKCFDSYGDIGFQIHFAGDLNEDGIPEIIFSESDETQGGTLYFFMSNSEGVLELKSVTGSVSGC